MRCPSCGTEQVDDSAAFCSRCGRPLARPEGEVTNRLTREPSAEDSSTTELTRPQKQRPPRDARSPFGPRRALWDFGYGVRRSLSAGGWLDAAAAACLAMLGLLCVGAVLLLAAKLQYPDLGTGSNPLSVFVSIVVLSVGSLRVPIHIGDLTVTALPLGALVLSAFVVSWAIEPAIRKRGVEGLRARVAAGAKIAAPFALLCWALALVFRFRGGDTPTHAGAVAALFLGGVWGALFGALGGVRSAGPLRGLLRAAAATLKRRNRIGYEGIVTGATMLGFAALLSIAAGLVWIIVGLARGAPLPHFGTGDAVAGLVYVLAFLPNVIVAIVAIAMGAPLDVGAQITIGGRQIGPLKTFSLWHWGDGSAPWYAYALLLLPIAATVAAGFLARRRARSTRDLAGVVGGAALVFSVTLALLAWLGQARLGAGLVRAHGFGEIAPNALLILLFAALWAAAGGIGGWELAERRGQGAPGESATPDGEDTG